mgnify:CR=1 FL=1
MRQVQFDHHSRNDQIEGRNDVVELEALRNLSAERRDDKMFNGNVVLIFWAMRKRAAILLLSFVQYLISLLIIYISAVSDV